MTIYERCVVLFLMLSLACTSCNRNFENDQLSKRIEESEDRWIEWKSLNNVSTKIKGLPKPPRSTLAMISKTNAPFDLEQEWRQNTYTYEAANSPVDISRVAMQELDSAKVFDCVPFELNKNLVDALQSARELRWIRLGPNSSSGDLNWICKLRHLRGLSLDRSNLADAELESLSSLKQLEWLSIEHVKLPRSGVRELPAFPNLEVLLLGGNSLADNQLPVAELPNLRVLLLSHSTISDKGIQTIVQAYPKLEYLSLYDCGNVSTSSIASLAKLQNLEYLSLSRTKLQTDAYESEFGCVPELSVKLSKCFIYFGS